MLQQQSIADRLYNTKDVSRPLLLRPLRLVFRIALGGVELVIDHRQFSPRCWSELSIQIFALLRRRCR